MAGEHVEITTQILHIHGEVGQGLCAIDQDGCTHCFSCSGDLFHRVDGAQRIAGVTDCDQLGFFTQQVAVGIQVQITVLQQRDHLDHGTGTLGDHLPGHDVGVVFQRAEDDLVTDFQVAQAPAIRHQVDRFGGAAGPDDLAAVCCVKILGHLLSCLFEAQGGFGTQVMRGTVNVGVGGLVVLCYRINHRVRFLCGGGVVQIGQRLAADLLRQNRKLIAQHLTGCLAVCCNGSASGRTSWHW